jgi:hypothetical protein
MPESEIRTSSRFNDFFQEKRSRLGISGISDLSFQECESEAAEKHLLED